MSRRLRAWSARHARGLHTAYRALERLFVRLHPLASRIGYERLDRPVERLERLVKGPLFDSQSCGQCVLASTGMSCPMNCPKSLRNGPCGGVRPDGLCEVDPTMTCVWVTAWEGAQRLAGGVAAMQVVQPPLDHRLRGHSAWLRAARERAEATPARD